MTRALAPFSEISKALAAIGRLERQVRQAKSLWELDDAADTAKKIQRRYRSVKEVSDEAGRVWVTAEIKLDEELSKEPKARGTRGQFLGGSKKLPPRMRPKDPTPTLKARGVDRKRAARAARLRALGANKRKQFEAELQAEDKAISPQALLQKQRQENKRDKKHELSTAVFSADGPFDCVVIDPPWQMEKIDRDDYPNQDAFDYPTMSEDEIAEFWDREIAPRLKHDCHVFMWTTQKWLFTAARLLEKAGARFVFLMTWHKSGGFQPIDLPQYNSEFVIYGRIGTPLFIDTKDFWTCFEGKRREHSRKPLEFYQTIGRVTGGSRLDVFARERHAGFAQYGNEVDKFAKVA